MTNYPLSSSLSTTELKASYNIPLVLVISSIPLLVVQPLLGGAIALFGLFLMFQAVSLRFYLLGMTLIFTEVRS